MIVRQFLLWSRTAPDDMRVKASSALARAYLRADLGAADKAELEMAFPLMIADPSPEVRLAIAKALCRHPLVPLDIVLALAELEGDAGLMVLARSPVLNDAELIERVEVGTPARQAAIAGRDGLSAPISAAIAEAGHAAACMALVENASADIPGFALTRIVERFSHLPAMREALLTRPDLPAAAHHALIRAVAGALTAFVAERDWVAGGDVSRIAREACERATMSCANGREAADVRALAQKMFNDGQLTSALVLRALLSGQMRLFLESVSILSGLPADRVAALAADRSMAAFRVLYDRIGLPRGAFIAFRTALQVLQSESYIDDSEGSADLRRRILDRVIEQYAALGEGASGNQLVVLLRRWQAEASQDMRTRRAA